MSNFSYSSSSSCPTYGYSSSSPSSFSSNGPSTPNLSSSSRRPSTSIDDVRSPSQTPPGSLRDYSASLNTRHRLGMAAAMKSIPLERPQSQARHDYDPNPFDALYSPSPTPAPRPTSSQRRAAEYMAVDTDEAEVEEAYAGKGKYRDVEQDAPRDLRPSLLNFRRQLSEMTTPGSVSSESSFEVSRPEDYLRIYGREKYSPFDLAAYIHDDSPLPTSLYQPPQNEFPFHAPDARVSVSSSQSASTEVTITSLSSSDTMTPLPSFPSAATSTASSPLLPAQIGVAGKGVISRPSLLRPRPRKHPYEASGRQRELSGGRGLSFTREKTEMQDDGRSVSEVMVAMAGLRCQRGRATRG